MDKEIQLYGYELRSHPVTEARLISLKNKEGNKRLNVPMTMYAVTTYFRTLFNPEKFSAPAHKMFTDVIKGMGGTIQKVVIDELKEGKFFATVYYADTDGNLFTEKAEASDAVAIAFCASCITYTLESIIEASENDSLNRVRWYDLENAEIMEKARALSHKKLVSLPSYELEQLLEIAANIEDFEFAARIKHAINVKKDKNQV